MRKEYIKKHKKILLIALENIDNVGDELLSKTTEFIVRSILVENEIKVAQLKPKRKQLIGLYSLEWLGGALVMKFSKCFKSTLSYKIKKIAYWIEFYRYFSDLILHTDKIILPVGMLKYSTQDFSYIFHLINGLATKYNKEVLMSAMSPQQADNNDWRYHQLVEAVNMPAVKMITTRDGQAGVDILSRDYIQGNVICDYVGDPALWIPNVYNIKRTKSHAATPHIGINVIRKGIFDDYNKSLTDEEMHDLYIRLIALLDEKRWHWTLFCNGMKSDWKVLWQLQSEIGFSKEHVAIDCSDGKSFAKMISQFDVVFGARLHTCITSVAVGTPVVGFIWENKLKCFSNIMGISHFFFNPQDMTAEKVMMKIEEAMFYNFDLKNREYYKQKTFDSIRKFLLS